MKLKLTSGFVIFAMALQSYAAAVEPTACTASKLSGYAQSLLDSALLKTGQQRREILISGLLKIRAICESEDDGAKIREYFPEKIRSDVEIALDIENEHPSFDGGFVATTLTNVRKNSKIYIQTVAPPAHCAKPETKSGITALYADRFHEKFLGFLHEATLESLYPHLVQSNLPSSAMIFVKVISNYDEDGSHTLEGSSGFVSASDTDWNESYCL